MAELAENFTSYWTKLMDALARSPEWITGSDLAGAPYHEGLGQLVGELTLGYCRGLSPLPEGAGSAEARAALDEAARRIELQLQGLLLSGGDAIARYGGSIAASARAASRVVTAAPPSAAITGGQLATHLARAAQAGDWDEVGKVAAAVGASSQFGLTATAGLAMAIAAVGALGPPSIVAALVLSAAAAFGHRWGPVAFADRDAIGHLLTLWLESSARAAAAVADAEPAPASGSFVRGGEEANDMPSFGSSPHVPASAQRKAR